MSIIGSELLLASAAATGYQVERSLRFNSADSAYLSRTPASVGNRKTWTWAGWVKRSNFGSIQNLFSAGPVGGDPTGLVTFEIVNEKLQIVFWGSPFVAYTDAVLRDPSAWYHVVLSVNTDNATAADRAIIYVNGVRASMSGSYPTQGTSYSVNNTQAHSIGRYVYDPGYYYNGYLADIYFIDGQALTPSSFTEVSATTGQLIPKAYSGTYGTNGFRLDFSNPLDLGNDAAGTNDWTPNNLSGVSGGPTSVAAASGALPIYNTTDTYGTTKGTGTRTDSNSSSIVLALPMDGSNNGTTFTDESATIKGSGSAKTLTRNGDTKTVTSQSKFYGSSCAFDGTGDFLSHAANTDFQFGTGNLTVELWVYFNSLPGSGVAGLVDTGTSVNANRFSIVVYPNGAVYVDSNANLIAGTAGKITAGKWIHIAVCRAGTGSNQTTLYIDGVTDKTATVSTNFSDSNLRIGATVDNLYLNGFIQDLRIYKGVAKYTNNFNPPSSTQNATVAAGNDSLVDTPTSYGTDTGAGGEVRGNYATLNPLNEISSGGIFSNGNLDFTGNNLSAVTTIGVTSGKWYFEGVMTATSGPGDGSGFGIYNANGQRAYVRNTLSPAFLSTITGVSSIDPFGSNFTTGDIIGVAFNADTGTLNFTKNGSAYGTQITGIPSGTWFLLGNCRSSTTTSALTVNFGQRPFAYTAPSGFKALCDTNLPAPVVAKPNTVMDVALWTGNGGNQSITLPGGFNPDLVWVKSRSNAQDHYLFDAVRGGASILRSNTTGAESTGTTYLSFDTSGFSSLNGLSSSGYTYAGWCFDAGSNTVSNTQGSITTSLRASASNGFSVATWTGTGSGSATVGHGLGVAPQFFIVKDRSNARNWLVYHVSMGATRGMQLNLTTAQSGADAGYWNNTAPTSTVATIGTYGNEAANYVGYFWAPVVGYSSFGSYTGNGSADGPFVYTGFRPRWIIYKRSSNTSDWLVFDTSRLGYNVDNDNLQANSSATESTSNILDILSNGFKLRTNDSILNGSDSTYIYAAFAESPFQYARAR